MVNKNASAAPHECHEPEAAASDSCETSQVEQVGRARGRPKKGQKASGVLKEFLANSRPGIYAETERSHSEFIYHCNACSKEVGFFRDAVTYVVKHEENSASHMKGLRIMGLSVDGQVVASQKPCEGVDVFACKALIAELPVSLRLWIETGQPCILASQDKKALLESMAWRMQDDKVFVRHLSCRGEKVASFNKPLMRPYFWRGRSGGLG